MSYKFVDKDESALLKRFSTHARFAGTLPVLFQILSPNNYLSKLVKSLICLVSPQL